VRNARRARLVLVVLLLAALTLVTIDARSGSNAPLRRLGSSVFGPVENAVSRVFRPVGSFFSGLAHSGSLKSQNTQLRNQVDSLRSRLAQDQDDETAYRKLEKLDGLANQGHFRMVFADVTSATDGASALGTRWTVAIDVGSADGIQLEQTVMDSAGLVGRVIRVSAHSSTVLLLCDREFSVYSYVGATGEQGFVKGTQAPDAMQLQLFDPKEDIAVGDRLVTHGDSNFAPQVPIGIVTAVEPGTTAVGGKEATVKPFVDVGRLGGDQVGVIVSSPRTVPRGALLPSSPPPTSGTSPAAGRTSTTGTHQSTGQSTTPGLTPTPGITP
jgi:rod shape-determining protein MreC